MNIHPVRAKEYTKEKRNIDRLWLFAIPTLTLLFFMGFFYLIWNLFYLTDQYAREVALRDAERFHNAIGEVRDYYRSAIIGSLKNSDIEFTHEYHLREGAIPMTPTVIRELGQIISNSNESSMAFYSDYPFPWQQTDLITAYPFRSEALDYLMQNPEDVFYRFESAGDSNQSVLRYATPSIMSESCVACHNTHPDSPKTDWEIGDVRGVLEVSVPVTYVSVFDEDAPSSRLIFSSILLLSGAIGLSVTGYNLRTFSLTAIEERSKKLEMQIKERELAEQKLSIVVKEARDANAAKSRFLATMSHELRTPLHVIIGYSEMLEEEVNELENLEVSSDLNRINRSGRHLLTLINDILDLSKVEAGKLDLNIKHTDICKIIQYVNDLASLFFKDSQTSFQLNVDPNLESIYTDETRFRQIIFNLLSNAAKFTERGAVFLNLHKVMLESGAFIELQVKDSGVGIPQEVIDDIFNPFVQGDSSTDRKYGGTGLGLSITRNLVQLLDGEITVESIEGESSLFTVHLPYQDRS